MDISANCVVIQAKAAESIWYVACVILATDKIDVNGVVRKYLKARKTSFAPMDKAVTMTAMEYGGITPIGLPASWPILVDDAVVHSEQVIIGSGVRRSKLLVPGKLLGILPNATVLDIAKKV
jgi:prolyl-tRNA editing enzyme YbaK/EbsC (Cys-tRNA(Pro) deacylase)